MKIPNILLILFLSILFFNISCTEENIINIRIDNLNGLKEGDDVICKGKKIGIVSNIDFIDRELNIQLRLEDDFRIPLKSEMQLISIDLFGTKAIEINLSENNEYYTISDTLICRDNSLTPLDTIINSTIEQIKESFHILLNKKDTVY